MTIFESGYKGLDHVPTPKWRRVLPVSLAEFRLLFRSRWGVVLFMACQAPAVVWLILLMIRTGVLQIGGPDVAERQRVLDQLIGSSPDSAAFYVEPVFAASGTFLAAMLLTTLISSRAVARDRQSQALEMLWTRGISPGAWFFGKWFGSFLLLGAGGIAAPLLLWFIAWGTIDQPDFLSVTLSFMPRLILGLVFHTAVLTALAVSCSALFRSPNVASMAWVFVLFVTDAAAGVGERLLRGQEWIRAVAPWDALRCVSEAVIGLTPARGAPVEVAVISLGLVGAWLGFLVARRLRATEAVG